MLTFESSSHKVNRMDSGDDHADKDGETKDAKYIKVTLGVSVLILSRTLAIYRHIKPVRECGAQLL